MSTQSSLLSLRISETEPMDDDKFAEAFAAALLEVADEYKSSDAKPQRTLGRAASQAKDDDATSSKKLDEKFAAAERKLEAARQKLEAAQLKLEQKAAAKRDEEERVIAKRMERERLVAEKRAEKERRGGALSRMFSWLTGRRVAPEKQLRVTESISLGEKRFVAVLQVEGRKFLIGGGAGTVSLLTALDASQNSVSASDAIHLVAGAGERVQ
jgi:hypothetical protein